MAKNLLTKEYVFLKRDNEDTKQERKYLSLNFNGFSLVCCSRFYQQLSRYVAFECGKNHQYAPEGKVVSKLFSVRTSYLIFSSDYNYNYEEYDYDLCSNPDEAHVTTGSCSHDEFFDSSVVERIQDKLIFEKSETRPCCKEHEYVFKDYCEVQTSDI